MGLYRLPLGWGVARWAAVAGAVLAWHAAPVTAQTTAASQPAVAPADASRALVDTLLKVFRNARAAEVQKDTATALLQLPASHRELADLLASKAEPAATKLAIVQALADLPGNPPAVFLDPLFEALLSSEPRLSQQAGVVLARQGDRRVVDKLAGLASDPARPIASRVAAVAALGQLSNQEALHAAIDRLIQLVDGPSDELANQAMDSLDQLTKISLGRSRKDWKDWWAANKNKPQEQWLKDLNEILVQRNRTLQAGNDLLRERLKATLEQLYTATPEAQREALLSGWLKDPLPLVQLAAMAKLDAFISNRQPDRITAALREVLRGLLKTADPTVRAQAVSLLGTLRDSASADAMLALLGRETEPAVKVELLFAAANLKLPQAVEVLTKALQDPSEVVVAGAARAMRQMLAAPTVPPEQAAALGTPLLERWATVRSDQPDLREALLSSLGALLATDPAKWSGQVGPAFRSSLKDDDADVKLAAVVGVGSLVGPADADQVARVLAEALADPDARVRAAAADGLGKLGRTPEQFELLALRSLPSGEADATVRDRAWAAARKMLASGSLEQFVPVIRKVFRPPFTEKGPRAERLADLAEATLKPGNGTGKLTPAMLDLADLAADAYIALGQYAPAQQMLAQLPDSHPGKPGRTTRVLVRVGDKLGDAVDYAAAHAGQAGQPTLEEFLQVLYDEAQQLAQAGATDAAAKLAELVKARLKPSEDWQRRFAALLRPAATQASGS